MKVFKILLFVALGLVVVGGAVLAIAIARGGSFASFGGYGEDKEQKHEELAEFQNINIDTDITDIEIVPSTTSKNYVVCYEKEKYYHEVSVEDGTLVIKSVDTRKQYEKMFSSVKNIKVIVYLKDTNYNELKIEGDTGDATIDKAFTFSKVNIKLSTGDILLKASVNGEVNIKVSTGDVSLEDMNVSTLIHNSSTGHLNLKNVVVSDGIDAKASTGKLTFTNVQVTNDIYAKTSTGRKVFTDVSCKNLTLEASTGDITLTRTIASEKLTIDTDTGDIEFDHSDAKTMSITTDTGDVKGNILTAKSFYVTGDHNPSVPKTSGEICEIKTDTGKVRITISDSE